MRVGYEHLPMRWKRIGTTGIRDPENRWTSAAIGEHGSIAVVERFILTMKNGSTRRYLVALRRETFRGELVAFIDWYNEYRPHTTLGGKTPEEVYHNRYPANRRPWLEPRQRWPRGSPCAKPQTLIAG